MIILLRLCILFLASSAGISGSQSASSTAVTVFESRGSTAPPDVRLLSSLEQVPVLVMDSNPFLKFVLGKTPSPHIFMNVPASSSSSSSAAEYTVAVNQSVQESEQSLVAFQDEESAIAQKSTMTFKKANDWLTAWNLSSKRRRIAPKPDELKVRRKLTEEFVSMVLRNVTASITGRQLQQAAGKQEQFQIVSHCLGNKATNTLATRVQPYRAYSDWSESKVISLEDENGEVSDPLWELGGWPPSESMAYEFAQSTKSATSVRMFLEFINFITGCFGFDFPEIKSSGRLHGYASIRLGALGFLRKAAIFVDALIAKLEISISCQELPKELRVACGNMLIKMLTRSRNSDWHHMIRFMRTTNRIKAIVARVKSSRLQDREELVLTGPIESATGRDWLTDYEGVRTEEGISLYDGWPLMPARDKSGTWLKEDASIQVTNTLYKAVVVRCGENPERVTSHSPRRTGATLAARGGLNRDQQAALLYHKVAGQKATRAYDESQLEGVIPQFSVAVKKAYTELAWTEMDTEIFIGDLIQTQKAPSFSEAEESEEVSSVSEVSDSEPEKSGVEDTKEKADAEVEEDWPELVDSAGKKFVSIASGEQIALGTLEDMELVEPASEEQHDPVDLDVAVAQSHPWLSDQVHQPEDKSPLSSSASAGDLEQEDLEELDLFPVSPQEPIHSTSELDVPQTIVAEFKDDGADPDLPSDIEDDEPQTLANRFGALLHLRSGKVHLAAQTDEGLMDKTRCGRKTANNYELKFEITQFDLLCSKCFRLPTISLPGRQSVVL